MKQWLRRVLDAQMKATEEGKPLARLRPLAEAIENFFFEAREQTHSPPHIRDAVDVKRWMMLVVVALVPCILMAIWNTGVQKFVYTSGDASVMKAFYEASHSLSGYFGFVFHGGRWLQILWYGLAAYIPIMLISYTVGGIVEVIFACARKKEISEGFLVSGMLFALILPPTIPYWMVALGVAAGITISKELFGGTGMNIVNPALCCRILLFFTFPAQMTGDIWVGTNPYVVRESLLQANRSAGLSGLDGYTQATPLSRVNVGMEIKDIHIDAIAATFPGVGTSVPSWEAIQTAFAPYAVSHGIQGAYTNLSHEALQGFLTDALHLPHEDFESAFRFAQLRYDQGLLTNWNLVLGNRPGSMGETSVLACLLGALFLIITGVGSWRTMCGVFVGTFGLGLLVNSIASWYGVQAPAVFTLPAYKHLLMGGLAFGAIFMATDPVSSPTLPLGRWIYGIFIGVMTMIIRLINPAYPEGVMLAIILANTVAPLIDIFSAKWYRPKRRAAFTNTWTIALIVMLSIVCALTLSIVADFLNPRKQAARDLDRNEQLLSAAKVYSLDGYFLMVHDGQEVPAKAMEDGVLVPGSTADMVTAHQVSQVFARRVRPELVTSTGQIVSYAQAGLDMNTYLRKVKFTKPSNLQFLPIFAILPNDGKSDPESYVLPVSGFGLWDKIAGFLAIRPDGKSVVGISWYDQKETPGLGATISEPWWQAQFSGKWIFQPNDMGVIDMAKSYIGIHVLKGSVADVLGKSTKAINAVDGMAGATLTGNGVTKAYHDSLEPYRPFFERLAEGKKS